MTKRGFQAKHGILRNAIRKDMLYFALPGIIVLCAGVAFSVSDGWDGIFVTLWSLISQPRNLFLLSGQKILGLALVLSGFTLAFVAFFTLKRSYSSTLVIREDHKLITHGVFRFVRHPIYLGVILVCIGMPVYASSLGGLVTMSVMIPIFLVRIRLEERLLTDEFGDAYRAYKEATRKLIPFVF